MFNEILQKIEPNFFQSRSETIKNTIHLYAETLQNNSISPEQREIIKNDSETILRNLMIESGYKTEKDAYISIDKEFFKDNSMDTKQVEAFQKKILMHYSAEQLKWTFAGTTSLYSPATIKTIEKKGVSYENMLPSSFSQKKYQKTNNDTLTSKKAEHDFNLYMYPDGSTSNALNQSKKMFSFNELKDKSGFNWSSGYSLTNNIKKDNWGAGFNKDDVWEKFSYASANSSASHDYSQSQEVVYAESSSPNNSIQIITDPKGNFVYIYDIDLKLMNAQQEEYFSLSGELYGVKEIDRERSIEQLKSYLRKNKITKISGFVLGTVSDETTQYYNTHFKEFIAPETKYAMPEDTGLNEIVSDLDTLQQETEISTSFISNFMALASKGRRGDELFDGMIPSTERSEYRVNLNIFDSQDDLKTFISLPDIKSILTPDTEKYLATVDVPETHKQVFSNSVQNILHNYKKYFTHSKIDSSDLVKRAYDIVVKKDKNEIQNARTNLITSERSLYELIVASKSGKIHSVTPYTLPKTEYKNIFQKDEFYSWAAGKTLSSANMKQKIESFRETIQSSKLSAEKKKAVIKPLQNYLRTTLPAKPLQLTQDSVKTTLASIETMLGLSPEKDIIIKTVSSIIDKNNRVEQIIDDTTGDIIQAKSFDEIIFEESLRAQGVSEALLQKTLTALQDHSTDKSKQKTMQPTVEQTALPETWEEVALHINKAGEEAKLTMNEKKIISQHIEQFKDADSGTTAALTSLGISKDIINSIWNRIDTSKIPDNKKYEYATSVQNMFSLFENIRLSAGLTPAEIISAIDNVIITNTNLDKYAKLRIFFNRPLADIIEESSETAPEPVRRIKEDLFLTKKADAFIPEIDLLNETDINTFALSPLLQNSTIPEDEQSEIISFLKNIKLPVAHAKDFSRGVINAIKMHKSSINPKGFKALEAIKSVERAIKGDFKDIPKEIRNDIVTALGPSFKNGSSSEIRKELRALANRKAGSFDLSQQSDIDYLVSSPLFPMSGISRTEAVAIGEILKSASIPKAQSASISRSLVRVMRKYKNSIAPLGYSPQDAAHFIIKNMNGQKDAIPAPIQALIDGTATEPVFEEKQQTSSADSDMIYISSLYEPEMFKKFVETDTFKKSGLDAHQLTQLLVQHKKALKKLNIPTRKLFPVQYASKQPATAQNFTFSLPPQAYMTNGHVANSLDNIAWSVSHNQNANNKLEFTSFGSAKLNPVAKNMILQQMQQMKKTDKSYISGTMPGLRSKKPAVSFEHKKDIAHNNNFVYSSSLPVMKGVNALQSFELQQKHTSPQNTRMQNEFYDSNSMVPKNIQQNYINDSQALAKSTSGSGSQTSTPQSQSNNADSGTKIKKALDELLNEFTTRMDDEF